MLLSVTLPCEFCHIFTRVVVLCFTLTAALLAVFIVTMLCLTWSVFALSVLRSLSVSFEFIHFDWVLSREVLRLLSWNTFGSLSVLETQQWHILVTRWTTSSRLF